VARFVSAKLSTLFQQCTAARQSRKRQTTKQGKLQELQKQMSWLVESNAFSQLFMVLILVNTISMAVEYDGMSSSMQDRLQVLNTILTWSFAAEVVLKVHIWPVD
jgi:Ion transport protein